MLSNLVISTQRLVVIVDELGKEKFANKFLCQLLREQECSELTIKTLPLTRALNELSTFEEFLKECGWKEQKWNVLLPPLSDLLCYQGPAAIFEFLQKLRACSQVKRTFLWVSPSYLMRSDVKYLIAACEYMADLVLRLETKTELSITVRKSGGAVTSRRLLYNKYNNQYVVEPVKPSITTREEPEEVRSLGTGTFKIELDEDELVARNALKLPYERTSEAPGGQIIYTPDINDDMDDEDPDEDLCI